MRWLALIVMLLASPAVAQTEREMQQKFCAGMAIERDIVGDGTRVDCFNDVLAIEVDWTNKWAEAIGQALYYGSQTKRRPGIILVCKDDQYSCLQHSLRLEAVLRAYQLPMSMWLCVADDPGLGSCPRVDFPTPLPRSKPPTS